MLVLPVLPILAASAIERGAATLRRSTLEPAPIRARLVRLAIRRADARATPLRVRALLPAVDGTRASSLLLASPTIGPVHFRVYSLELGTPASIGFDACGGSGYHYAFPKTS